MSGFRVEKDLLGKLEVPDDALYGIHALRAKENFPIAHRIVNNSLIHAYGAVKLACAKTNHEMGRWDNVKFGAIESACLEMMDGRLDRHIIVDALQGGAGTSTNMNVNEVLSNRALEILGKPLGEYSILNPLEDINLHQSTNDTYPTALRIAAISEIKILETEIVGLFEEFQKKEKEFAGIVKVGRTEMQDAVLTTLGREMSAYAEAISRDRWRIYKCVERLRVVNLGGTAIGTGISAPRTYIFRVIEHLPEITGMNLSRAENMIEATQNTDIFVEVSGMLKACATNLLKISGDLRLLSSGPHAGINEINLPERQAGSTIMPGKVNPVILEAVTQAALLVMSNDQSIASACSMGNLELNAFMPLIADKLLESIQLLTSACSILRRFCVSGIAANKDVCKRSVENATATIAALVDAIGYEKAEEIALEASKEGKSLKQIVIENGLLTAEQFEYLTSPEQVMKLGSTDKKDRK
jgi:aspartate ammonia-lyase